MRTQFNVRIIAFIGLLLCLSACGQKGPLKLPEPEKPVESSAH